MSNTRSIFSGIIGGAISVATAGGINGSLGASILAKAGYVGYSATEAARTGALGGLVVGAAQGLGSSLYKMVCSSPASEAKEEKISMSYDEAVGNVVASIGTSVAGGVLGRVMLDSVCEMSLEKTAAALAVGGATMIPITFAVLAVVVVGVYCCYSATAEKENTDLDVGNTLRPR